MRIAHVVAYVSADGSYGGPISVAFAQLQALHRQGNQCTLYAGWDGIAKPATEFETRLFRAKRLFGKTSFSLLHSLKLLRELSKASKSYDVVHVHLARDLLTMPAAVLVMLHRVPLVIQTHGMIVQDNRLLAKTIDKLVTRRLFKRAKHHITLTDAERASVTSITPKRDNITHLDNGVFISQARSSWSNQPDVVFCARLHSRKRPGAFVEMAAILVSNGSQASFKVAGPDEGELAALEQQIERLGLNERVSVVGPVNPENVAHLLQEAQIFVLPSVDEPFPMTVLEAMALGLPSVITNSNGLSSEIANIRPYLVCDGSPEQLAYAINHLTSSRQEWSDVSAASAQLVNERFSINAISKTLLSLYSEP